MVSVIMLTYNREAFVGRAIESILAQTDPNFEFIIVDNGSTDHSGKIADEYAAKDRRIRVIHQERGSIGAGRNAGLDMARGDYIAFFDDDDWVEPDYLAFLLALAEGNNADVAICGTPDKSFDVKQTMGAEEALFELLQRKKFNVGFPTKLIRRELFHDCRFSEASRFDDIYLMPNILGCAGQVAYHGLPKYHVVRHAGNNSAWTTNHALMTPEIIAEYLKVYEDRTEWLCKNFPDNGPAWQYFEWSFMISMVEKITRLKCPGCDALKKSMTSILRKNRDAFYHSVHITDFEKEWLDKFIMRESEDEHLGYN